MQYQNNPGDYIYVKWCVQFSCFHFSFGKIKCKIQGKIDVQMVHLSCLAGQNTLLEQQGRLNLEI